MELKEAIYSRRSVRSYDPNVKVPREVLDRIVAAGIEAPSGCNGQFRHYIIVDDASIVSQLSTVSSAMKGANAAIVIVMEPKAARYGEYWVQDAAAAMQNMLLTAVDEGYASCWVEGPMPQAEPLLRKILGVPENLRVWCMMPVGKPAETAKRPEKSMTHEVVSYNKFTAAL